MFCCRHQHRLDRTSGRERAGPQTHHDRVADAGLRGAAEVVHRGVVRGDRAGGRHDVGALVSLEHQPRDTTAGLLVSSSLPGTIDERVDHMAMKVANKLGGLRLPKPLLEQIGLGEGSKVDLKVKRLNRAGPPATDGRTARRHHAGRQARTG